MQEAEGEVQRIPAKRYLFHNCPVCESVSRFPEDSTAPNYFNEINNYLQFLVSREASK